MKDNLVGLDVGVLGHIPLFWARYLTPENAENFMSTLERPTKTPTTR